MPTVRFEGEEIECEEGDNLREALLEAGLTPHKGFFAQNLNCGGNATCGTCAVIVDGEVGEETIKERRRLSLPDKGDGVRLSCQCTVLGDVEVEKP